MRTLVCGFFQWIVKDILRIRSTDIQSRNLDFCLRCFGFSNTFNKRERAYRYAEEAMELLQAAGLTKSEVEYILSHVYSKEVGDLRKELANAQQTLLALSSAYGIHLEDEVERDLKWANENIPHIREKYFKKPDEIIGDKLGILLHIGTVHANS